MQINESQILDHGDWFTYKYESSTISAEKIGDDVYPEYIHVVMFYTDKKDQGKGYFKKNILNIVEHAKSRGYKGIYMFQNKIRLKARNKIEIGVNNGWIEKIDNIEEPIYIIK